MTKIWDEKRNPMKNYFYKAFKVINESDLPYDISSNEFSSIQELNSLSKTNEESTIPSWVKFTAGWWADDQIDDSSFVEGIQFLIKEEFMKIHVIEQGSVSQNNEIPEWIKNTAGWWAEGMLSDDEFVKGIQYLMTSGVISV